MFVYYPGLSGPFLFDDWVNLPVLGFFGPVDNWPVFWRYLTAGVADPTGRPVAQLSFLLDAQNWPADPFPFKRTNLIIHLLNGALLYILLLQLNRLLGLPERRQRWIALLASALWLLHPLWVSSVLYVIQRQALLVGTWTLLTLIAYVRARKLLPEQPHKAMAWMTLCLTTGTILATFSKANGALLPLMTGMLEVTILQSRGKLQPPRQARQLWAIWRWVFLWIPTLMLAAWLLWRIPQSAQTALDYRPFTLEQRILTQPRILFEYLGLLFFPRPYTNGLFNDAFPYSADLLHPWTTLPALLGILGLIFTAWKLRKRFPVVAFAILFFFSGHFLESTVLPLELYFEHRNYVPALFLFWPVAIGLCSEHLLAKPFRTGIALVLIAFLALFTGMRAGLWGNAGHQAYLWARFNPDSARAQTYAAQHDIGRRRYSSAVERLEKIGKRQPDSVQVVLNLISAKCAMGKLSGEDIERAAEALTTSKRGRTVLMAWTKSILRAYGGKNSCQGIDYVTLNRLLDAAAQNRQFRTAGGKQDIDYLRGLAALHLGHPREALNWFKEAIVLLPEPEAILELSAEFARRGYLQEALSLLGYGKTLWEQHEPSGWNMQALHNRILHKQKYWDNEFRHLEQIVQQHMKPDRDVSREGRSPGNGPDS